MRVGLGLREVQVAKQAAQFSSRLDDLDTYLIRVMFYLIQLVEI